MQIREGFRQTDTGFNLDIEEEYYKNQQWYIQREIEEYNNFRSNKEPALLLRGPEDLEFYTLHYPFINNYNWNVEYNLKKELAKLRLCRSDYIIYLDASAEEILKRKNNDKTKPRINMQNWLQNWQPYIEPYMKKIPYTTVFDTTYLSSDELLEVTASWILKRI